MPGRESAAFDESLTTERGVLKEYISANQPLPTDVRMIGVARWKNPAPAAEIGAYRPGDARKLVTADVEIINEFISKGQQPPTFLEAGPREFLLRDPRKVRAAIVTTGGLAPGLNSIVHSIVKRHFQTYELNEGLGGAVFGVYDSFVGLQCRPMIMKPLKPDETEEWLERGGSELGNRRTKKNADLTEFARDLADNLSANQIEILYVIGGDGSQTLAHEIANHSDALTVLGLPKTMDNDLLWVWQSFGFNTAVERATEVINVMNCEAHSTRRICIIELFGAESGFVAANAALASGHADLVMVPEAFDGLNVNDCDLALEAYVDHLRRLVNRDRMHPHALVVAAEGVGRLLSKQGAHLGGQLIREDFIDLLREHLAGTLKDTLSRPIEAFINRPLHSIRAGKANAHDQIYCERLGALAVDNALAGYTDCMVSQWLTEYVLVPLQLVAKKRKRIPPEGIFWKQVCSSTGQPTRAYVSQPA